MSTHRLTDHARERCVEMGIPTKRVKRALRDEERIEYRGGTEHPPGRRVVVADGLAIVVSEKDRSVVTVLWHGRTGRDGECRTGGVQSDE